MKKKNLFIILCITIALIILGIITRYADSGSESTNNEPRYCIKIASKDENKVTYWGLGYKIIRYVSVSLNEPYQNNIGAKMGGWFMNYELPIDSEDNQEENADININSLNDFYNTELTKNMDIKKLGTEYSSFDAQKDNCFVIGAMVHNDYLYHEFMESYKNSETSFIRVAQNTVEGDLIIYDLLYYKKTDKLYLVTDNTRDNFATKTDRKVELKQFERTSEYKYENRLYWILYNGEINDENFTSDNVFIITTIN